MLGTSRWVDVGIDKDSRLVSLSAVVSYRCRGLAAKSLIHATGNGRLEAQCFDGTRRLGHIRGKLRKKVWINQGDIILLSLRDYQDEKGDVMYVSNSHYAAQPPIGRALTTYPSLKYSADEARSLKAYGELPENAKINETDTYGDQGDEGIGFEFDEDRDDSDSEDGKDGKDLDIDDI